MAKHKNGFAYGVLISLYLFLITVYAKNRGVLFCIGRVTSYQFIFVFYLLFLTCLAFVIWLFVKSLRKRIVFSILTGVLLLLSLPVWWWQQPLSQPGTEFRTDSGQNMLALLDVEVLNLHGNQMDIYQRSFIFGVKCGGMNVPRKFAWDNNVFQKQYFTVLEENGRTVLAYTNANPVIKETLHMAKWPALEAVRILLVNGYTVGFAVGCRILYRLLRRRAGKAPTDILPPP